MAKDFAAAADCTFQCGWHLSLRWEIEGGQAFLLAGAAELVRNQGAAVGAITDLFGVAVRLDGEVDLSTVHSGDPGGGAHDGA